MQAVYKKLVEMVAAIKAGEWEQVKMPAYVLLGWVLGIQQIPLASPGGEGINAGELRLALTDLNDTLASPPREAREGSGAMILMFIQALAPLIKAFIEQKIQDK